MIITTMVATTVTIIPIAKPTLRLVELWLPELGDAEEDVDVGTALDMLELPAEGLPPYGQ